MKYGLHPILGRSIEKPVDLEERRGGVSAVCPVEVVKGLELAVRGDAEDRTQSVRAADLRGAVEVTIVGFDERRDGRTSPRLP